MVEKQNEKVDVVRNHASGALLFAACLVLLCSATTAGILLWRADSAGLRSAHAFELRASVNRAEAIELDVLANRKAEPGAVTEMHQLRAEILRLAAEDTAGDGVRIRRHAREWSDGIARYLAAIRAGRFVKAHAIDKGVVDSTYNKLGPELTAYGQNARAASHRARKIAGFGSLLSLAAGLGIAALLLRRHVRDSRRRSVQQAERSALARSERRLTALLANVADAIFVVGERGQVAYATANAEQLLGEAVCSGGADLMEAVAPADRRSFLTLLVRAAAGDEHAGGEIEMQGSAGRPFVAELTARCTTEGLREIVVTIRDVSVRKTLEDQLRQSQKLEALGQLAGGIAHDFNNLLLGMRGYCELALQRLEQGDARAADHLQEVLRGADRATELTKQLLAFGRKQMLQPRIFDLNEVVTDLGGMLGRLIRADIDLHIRCDATTSTINADPTQLEQVLMNLVANARDAMPAGGRLEVETSNVDVDRAFAEEHPPLSPGRFVRLRVTDAGTGIEPEVRARLFEPFFTTKDVGKGTGLGLATVYGIVEQSGGHIFVESELGHGTTFSVYLPLVEGVQAVGSPTRSDTEGSPASETILLVEDTPSVRDVIVELLGHLGYRVLAASNPEEVTAHCARESRIDLLITDVVMPGEGGPALAARLIAARPQLKVLYVSGYAGQNGTGQDMPEGSSFLQKPFSGDELGRAVRDVLDGSAGAGELREAV